MNANNLYSSLLKTYGIRPQRWHGSGGAYFYWVDRTGAAVTDKGAPSVYVNRLDDLNRETWESLAKEAAAAIAEEQPATKEEPLPPAPEGLTWRWTLTHVDDEGFRVFTLDNRAASHKAEKEQAERALAAMFRNNTVRGLREVYGPHVIATLRVDPVLCWGNGDRAPGKTGKANEYHPHLDLRSSDEEREKIAKAFTGSGGTVVRLSTVKLSFGRTNM